MIGRARPGIHAWPSVQGCALALLCASLTLGVTPAWGGYGERTCGLPQVRCLTVMPGDRWDTLVPDPEQRALAQRLNRTNLRLRTGETIAVPSEHDGAADLMLAPFPAKLSPWPVNRIIVDQSQLAWGAFDTSGRLIKWGPMSGGKSYCADLKRGCRTRPGRFTIYRKEGAGCRSKKFPLGRGGAKMPYCMFYHGGYAIHGSYKVPGYHASHGCVRIFVEDARWLARAFVEVGETQVWIDQPLDARPESDQDQGALEATPRP